MTRWSIALSIVAGAAIIVVFVLTVISGILYRMDEMDDGETSYAPDWIEAGTYAGIVIAILAVLGLIIIGVVALARRGQVRSHAS